MSASQIRAHDRPRDLIPVDAWHQAMTALRARVPGGVSVVEVGIGSGAYGGRLAELGVDVVGVDLNETMLRSARSRWPELGSRLALADARRLPLAGGCIGAVLIAHVLHLVQGWRAVLAESVRLLQPQGVLAITGGGGIGRSGIGQLFRSALGDAPPLPGASSRDEIADAVTTLGGARFETISVEAEGQQSRRDFIDRLEHNLFAWHPDIDEARLARAAEVTRLDVAERGLDLDEPVPTPVRVHLDLFRLEG